MRKSFSIYITIVLLVCLISAGMASRVQAFGFAPPESAQAISHDSNTDMQLSVLDTWQSSAMSMVPQNVRNQVSVWDSKRLLQAQVYANLQKTALGTAQTANKGQASSAQQPNPPIIYYWYGFLAFFLGHAYVFYGALLILIFLLLRLVLVRLNFIA